MKILIVDDDATTLLSLAERVRLAGHEADAAATEPEALALLAANRYDVAAVDLVLGSRDGTGVARAALDAGARVVIESGREEGVIRESVEALGAPGRVVAIQKPFEAAQLLQALEVLDAAHR